MSDKAHYFLDLVKDLRREVAGAIEKDDTVQRMGAYQRGRDHRAAGLDREAAPPETLPHTRADWLRGYDDQKKLEGMYPQIAPTLAK